ALPPGGPTWRHFCPSHANRGYCALELLFSGGGVHPCRTCGTPIESAKHGQRSTFFCGRCQR
ncbi:zinc finger domain-containing protein, partial [Serratia ureilytica]|uniref:zinc finger domain-containing protein n=1 Tax=Serratia ureilytica TaxID=300181 RepID=UPI002F967FA5